MSRLRLDGGQLCHPGEPRAAASGGPRRVWSNTWCPVAGHRPGFGLCDDAQEHAVLGARVYFGLTPWSVTMTPPGVHRRVTQGTEKENAGEERAEAAGRARRNSGLRAPPGPALGGPAVPGGHLLCASGRPAGGGLPAATRRGRAPPCTHATCPAKRLGQCLSGCYRPLT